MLKQKGEKYSVKGPLSLATGLPTSKFNTGHAEKNIKQPQFCMV